MKEKLILDYHLSAGSLKQALSFALEFYSLNGFLEPDRIRLDDHTNVPFDITDAICVRDGEISESDYIKSYTHDISSWADGYFSPSSGGNHVDVLLPLKEVADSFRIETGCNWMTTNGFRRCLAKFAESCPYIDVMNPYDLCTVKPDEGGQNGRILRRLRDDNGHPTGAPVDYIYMKSRKVSNH